MQIGTIIRQLRKEKDITQEQLAEFLSISSRAVSQWETGKTMPDISQLPVLANIFNVTTDYLLGVNFDEKSKIINSIIEKAQKSTIDGNHTTATSVLREGLNNYPDNHKIIHDLAWSLWYERDFPINKELYETMTLEIIKFGEFLLSESTDNEIRNSIIYLLCLTYPNINQLDKAVELAEKMPNKYLSRENLLYHIYNGTMRFEVVRDSLWSSIAELYNDMLFNNRPLDDGSKPYATKELLLIHQKYFDIMNIFFEDGNFGFFREQIARAYCKAAAICLVENDIELALKYLKTSINHAIIYDTKYNPDDEYTCTIFKGKKFGGVIWNTNKNLCKIILDDINYSNFDKIRNNNEFLTMIKELEKFAGFRNNE